MASDVVVVEAVLPCIAFEAMLSSFSLSVENSIMSIESVWDSQGTSVRIPEIAEVFELVLCCCARFTLAEIVEHRVPVSSRVAAGKAPKHGVITDLADAESLEARRAGRQG